MLEWACTQPFSDGRLALAGFSASAIMLFNSWHQELPCVEAAVTRSGTHELYRDLLVPGGVTNLLPGAGVLALIGGTTVLQGADRLDDPASALDAFAGLFSTGRQRRPRAPDPRLPGGSSAVGAATPTTSPCW